MHRIFIVSDGTGVTAEQSLRAALTQFADTEVRLDRRPGVRDEARAREVIEEASQVNGLVVHTVVSKDLRRALVEIGRLYNVEVIDLMGPLLARLTDRFASSPSERPGLFRELNAHYFQRIEAMEFAFRHDDGQRVHELDKAEIILVGVSRTFKTPLSIYLAFRGWLVGNVPIVLNLPVPDVLFDLPDDKVFALSTSARRLAALRSVRHQHLGGSTGLYAEFNYVQQELAYAMQAFEKRPKWRIVDVTDKPIEEIASEILDALRASSEWRDAPGPRET